MTPEAWLGLACLQTSYKIRFPRVFTLTNGVMHDVVWGREARSASGTLCPGVHTMEDRRRSRSRRAQLQLTVEGRCCADEATPVEQALKQLDGGLEGG